MDLFTPFLKYIADTSNLKLQLSQLQKLSTTMFSKKLFFYRTLFIPLVILLIIGIIYAWNQYQSSELKWKTIREDFNILPYQVSQSEIDSLEGIWLCYTSSPQARLSDPNPYHKVVANLIEVKYKMDTLLITGMVPALTILAIFNLSLLR